MLQEKQKNAFILQYGGELIGANEARARETEADDESVYRFFFSHGKKNSG